MLEVQILNFSMKNWAKKVVLLLACVLWLAQAAGKFLHFRLKRLAAAEAQYHVRCYDSFRKIPTTQCEQSVIIVDDEAMQKLVDEMYANQKLRTWTSIELHEKYVSYGGNLTRKQMFSNLITHFGDDVVVLSIDGNASVVGFQVFWGNVINFNFVMVDAEDDMIEDALVRKIINEAHKIPFNNKYDLGDFVHSKVKEQTGTTLLRVISKLVSNGKITKRSLSLSQSIASHYWQEQSNNTWVGHQVSS